MPHPFEFSVSLPTGIDSLRKWADQLRRIEDMGFHSLVMADHFTDGYELEPTVALTAAAVATSTIRIQTGVLGNDYRHPVLTARIAATLDNVSDGRFTLGLGAGWMRSDYEAAGIPLDRAGMRVSRLEEAVKLITGLLRGGRVEFHGQFYQVDLELLPIAVQRPVPLFVGGGSPRVLGIAGRHAQIAGIVASLSAGELGRHAVEDLAAGRVEEKIGWIRKAAREAGRSPEDVKLEMNHWLVRVTPSQNAADEFLAKVGSRSDVDPDLLASSPAVLVGPVGQIKEQLAARREQLGISCIQLDAGFSPHDLDALAPIVADLAGA